MQGEFPIKLVLLLLTTHAASQLETSLTGMLKLCINLITSSLKIFPVIISLAKNIAGKNSSLNHYFEKMEQIMNRYFRLLNF